MFSSLKVTKNLGEILRRKIRAEPEMEAAMATIVGPAPLESSDYILNRFISTRYDVSLYLYSGWRQF